MEESVIQEKAKAHRLHMKLIKTYRTPFEEFFKVSLDDYWLPHDLGFDMIKFEDDVIGCEVKEGRSMEDVIFRDYGPIGVQTIKGLIGMI